MKQPAVFCIFNRFYSILLPTFCKYLFFRSSPLVDVPEVNSRIALRTIQKSSNDGNDEICNGEAGQSRSGKKFKKFKKSQYFTKNFKTLQKISKNFLGDGGCILDPNSVNTGTHNTAFTVRLFWVEN